MSSITIEQTFPVTESKHFGEQELNEETISFLVRVIATPDYYAVKADISPLNNSEYTLEKIYKPAESREISSQIINNEAKKLTGLLGAEQAVELATQLDFAGDLAASISYGDVVGMDEIKKYKRGMISPEELVNSFGEKIIHEMDTNV